MAVLAPLVFAIGGGLAALTIIETIREGWPRIRAALLGDY